MCNFKRSYLQLLSLALIWLIFKTTKKSASLFTLEVLSFSRFTLCVRTLPSKFMDSVAQTVSKFNISALLVIGGFEAKKRPSDATELCACLTLLVLFTLLAWHFIGLSRCVAAVWSTELLQRALHPHVCNPRHHQQQRARHTLQPRGRHGCQLCHGGKAVQGSKLAVALSCFRLNMKQVRNRARDVTDLSCMGKTDGTSFLALWFFVPL